MLLSARANGINSATKYKLSYVLMRIYIRGYRVTEQYFSIKNSNEQNGHYTFVISIA